LCDIDSFSCDYRRESNHIHKGNHEKVHEVLSWRDAVTTGGF